MLTYKLTEGRINKENIVSRILVVDKSPIIPFAIKKLLAYYPYMNVVGQCHDRYSVVASLKKHAPSLVIIDPELCNTSNLDVVKQLQRHMPDVKIIVFMHEHITMNLQELIKLKVQGIVLKGGGTNNLLSAIHAVCRGLTFMDKQLTPHSTASIELANFHDVACKLALPKISPREKQILGMISQGFKNKEIAQKLIISIKTVESHRLNLMKKLDAHNIVDLMKWAIRLDIV